MLETVRQGIVDWTGDNPFIYLKNDPAGDWSSLSLFFRIAHSSHGRGSAILVLEKPYEPDANGVARFCITDNKPLAKYLITDFVKKFGLFRPSAKLLDELHIIDGAGFKTTADYPRHHSEIAYNHARGIEVAMVWEDLGAAFAVDVPPEKSQTTIHEMFSVFQPATQAHVTVSGRRLAGTTVQRDFFGGRAQSAALAHSETWVRF